MNIPDKLRHLFFFRQHPDAALRYLPIVELLKKNGWENLKILEVGSGSYGITPYFKRQIVGIDLSFDEPKYPLLKQTKGSAIKLPFKDNKFDVVILSDVLEHLPKNIRQKALNEAVRVGKMAVIVSGPFDDAAFTQDQKLAEYSLKKIGVMHKFFKDHLKYGLPEISDVNKYVENNTKVKKIEMVGNYLNLKVREQIMKFFLGGKFSYYFYLKGLMFLVPLLKLLNQKPCYRTLVLIKL